MQLINNSTKWLLPGILLLTLSTGAICDIYKWTDEHGKVHFGDNSHKADTTNEIETVTVKDKYTVPVAEELTPIAYRGEDTTRTVVFNEITLDLPGADQRNVLIGRVVCGRPVDLYWTQGFAKLEHKYLGPVVEKVIEEQGYSARSGNLIREAGDLKLTAKIKKIFLNTCVKNEKRKLSQDSTYLKVEWTLNDPMTDKDIVVFTSEGSHIGAHKKAVVEGTNKSLAASFTMAIKNALSNKVFVQSLSEKLGIDRSKISRGEELKLDLNYSTDSKAFEDSAEELKKRTVIVKTENGHGSGVFIAANGYILTNAHVVGDESEFDIVSETDNYIATLVKKNAVRDVALLKIKGTDSTPTPVSISKATPGIGEALYVIGTPLDMKFSHTITRGIVSAKRQMRGMNYIQTDASINFGNSGGPVFNRKGELIAISVSSLMTQEGATLNINYLIPIDDALLGLNVEPKLSVKGFFKNLLSDRNSTNAQDGSKPSEADWRDQLIDRVYDWLNEPVYHL
jgi:serine protease Do